jgi:hypothetical protein
MSLLFLRAKSVRGMSDLLIIIKIITVCDASATPSGLKREWYVCCSWLMEMNVCFYHALLCKKLLPQILNRGVPNYRTFKNFISNIPSLAINIVLKKNIFF